MTAQEPPVPVASAGQFRLSVEAPADARLSTSTGHSRPASLKGRGFRAGVGLENVARRTLGILLLMVTVFLWTASNFLASNIFADDTYSKPFFVTYFNTSCFAISLIPVFLRRFHWKDIPEVWAGVVDFFSISNCCKRVGRKSTNNSVEDRSSTSYSSLLGHDEEELDTSGSTVLDPEARFTLRETSRVSLEFALLWFSANYLVAVCLEYTSVASSTILTSTTSIWTLIFGAMLRVEHFTIRKLIGVLASLAGIVLISTVDLSGKDNDENRGKFPHKSQGQIALGDAMAFGSAVMYGIYTVVMKKRVGNEDRVSMPLFFGLVGFFNILILWPGFLIFHFTGFEKFGLPPTGKVWTVVLLNAASSFISDYCWAYAMLLTSPLVVTVGISMSIPLSLVGQIVVSEQYSTAWYWVGACIVLLSFLFINHETKEEVESDGS